MDLKKKYKDFSSFLRKEKIIDSPISEKLINKFIEMSGESDESIWEEVARVRTKVVMKGKGPQRRVRFNYCGIYLSFSLFVESDGKSVNIVYGGNYAKIGWIDEDDTSLLFAGLKLSFDFKNNDALVFLKK